MGKLFLRKKCKSNGGLEIQPAGVCLETEIVQLYKNVRENKSILGCLRSHCGDYADNNLLTIGTDVIGLSGYLYVIKQFENVVVTTKAHDENMFLPADVDEIMDFMDINTLDQLLNYMKVKLSSKRFNRRRTSLRKKHERSGEKPEELSEDSFTINVFDPISKPFITHFANFVYHSNNHVLEASKERMAKQSSGCIGRKPDRAVDVIVDGISYNILIVEIKTGGQCKGLPDLVKLGTMMKDNVNFVLEQGCSRKKYYRSVSTKSLVP